MVFTFKPKSFIIQFKILFYNHVFTELSHSTEVNIVPPLSSSALQLSEWLEITVTTKLIKIHITTNVLIAA